MRRTADWSTQSTDISTTQSLTQDQEDIAEEEAKKNVRARRPVWDISCQTVFYGWQGKYTQEMETASLPIQDLKLIALIDMVMWTGGVPKTLLLEEKLEAINSYPVKKN